MTSTFKRAAAALVAALVAFLGLAGPAFATGGGSPHPKPTFTHAPAPALSGHTLCIPDGGWKAVWTLDTRGQTIAVDKAKLTPENDGAAVPPDELTGVVDLEAVYGAGVPDATLEIWYHLKRGGDTKAITGNQGGSKLHLIKKLRKCDCTTPPTTTPPTTEPTTEPTTPPPTTEPTTPPTTEPPAPTTPPTVEPTTAPPAGAAPGGGSGALPLTGPAAPAIAGVAAVLLAAGGAFLFLTRRRRARFIA